MAESRVNRKLAAILSADVVGYSRLMADDEAATVDTIKQYRVAVSHVIERHKGRIVNAPGDNILAEFASAVEAVQAAVEIQRSIEGRNVELPEERRMHFRIGLNLGDVIEEDDGTIYGDGVNIAARMEALADEGGICISSTIHDAVEGKLDFGFDFLGERPVKNIKKPVRVYRVRGDVHEIPTKARTVGLLSGKGIGMTVAGLLAFVAILVWIFYQFANTDDGEFESVPKASMVVLPFVNMSGDPEQEYFADGITETLITDLSKLRGLFVIARNSAFTYKNKATDLRSVARELGVRYVLEGSVQRAGERIRLNAKLVEADSGDNLWAERFDRPISDVFAVQDEITRQIVTELEVELVEGERARIWRRKTMNPAAYDALMKGRRLWFQFTREANAEAGHWLEQAIALDPQFAMPYAFLAWKEMMDYRYSWSDSPAESLKHATPLAEKAIELDDQLPMGYFSLGYTYFLNGLDKDADIEFQKGFALNPNDALGLGTYGIMLMYRDRYSEALDYFSRMLRLSPVPNPGYLHFRGETYRLMGRYDDAIDTLSQTLALAPAYMGARVKLICAYVAAGRVEEAKSELATLLENHPAFSVSVFENDWAPKSTSFRDPEELGRMADLLRTAGLPE